MKIKMAFRANKIVLSNERDQITKQKYKKINRFTEVLTQKKKGGYN